MSSSEKLRQKSSELKACLNWPFLLNIKKQKKLLMLLSMFRPVFSQFVALKVKIFSVISFVCFFFVVGKSLSHWIKWMEYYAEAYFSMSEGIVVLHPKSEPDSGK